MKGQHRVFMIFFGQRSNKFTFLSGKAPEEEKRGKKKGGHAFRNGGYYAGWNISCVTERAGSAF